MIYTLANTINYSQLTELLIRFVLNSIVSVAIVKYLYLPNSKQKEYLFTFLVLSTSIFILTFVLESVKIKVGFALGLFAIFGILRYRTSQIPIKEMTYMFVFISIAVINGMTTKRLDYSQLIAANLILFLVTLGLERYWMRKIESSKKIKYEKIDLILPNKNEELLADLKKRTGLNITRFYIGNIDYLKDTANIVVFYYENNIDK